MIIKTRHLICCVFLLWINILFIFQIFLSGGLADHGYKKINFFLEQGIVRVRANNKLNSKLWFAMFWFLIICDTLRLSRNIRVPPFNYIYSHIMVFFPIFFLFFCLCEKKMKVVYFLLNQKITHQNYFREALLFLTKKEKEKINVYGNIYI